MGPKIRAGCYEELVKPSGEWLFIDIGFSSKKKSCGFLKGWCTKDAKEVTFDKLAKLVCKETSNTGSTLNIVIEAPLSVAFNKGCNPTFRRCDIPDGNPTIPKGHRGWYINAGASTMVAAGYLLRRVSDCRIQREVRLFEGFVTGGLSHKKVVKELRCAVRNPTQRCVVAPCQLKASTSDKLQSAFPKLYCGIPPVVIPLKGKTQPPDDSG